MIPNTYHLTFNRYHRDFELCKDNRTIKYFELNLDNFKNIISCIPYNKQRLIHYRFKEYPQLKLHCYIVGYPCNQKWSRIGYIIFKDNIKYDTFRIVEPFFYTPKDISATDYIKEIIINKQNN